MKGYAAAAILVGMAMSTGARAATLWVAFPSRAAPCDLDQFEAALRSRVGSADVRPGVHDMGGSDVAVAVGHEGERWSLRVRASGERQLRRSLPAPGADCVALTETAASMVERYLDDIRWSGGSALVAPIPAPQPPTTVPWQLLLELGGSGAIGPLGVVPSGQLEVGARHGAFQLEVTAALAEAQQQPVTPDPARASIQLQTTLLQLSAGYRLPLAFGTLRVEAAPGVELVRATAVGSLIFDGTPRSILLPFLGARLAYELPLGRRLGLTVRVEGRGLLARQAFAVDLDPTQTRVETPAVDGDAGLSVSYLFF